MRSLRLIVMLIVFTVSGCAWQQLFSKPPALSQEEQIEELVRTIDANPDPLHGDYTPSVDKLIKVGEPALPRMLDLMLSDNEGTRLHAQRVIQGITLEQHGFVFGQGWRDPNGEERFRVFWESLGSLPWKAPLAERERAVKLWREWLAKNKS